MDACMQREFRLHQFCIFTLCKHLTPPSTIWSCQRSGCFVKIYSECCEQWTERLSTKPAETLAAGEPNKQWSETSFSNVLIKIFHSSQKNSGQKIDRIACTNYFTGVRLRVLEELARRRRQTMQVSKWSLKMSFATRWFGFKDTPNGLWCSVPHRNVFSYTNTFKRQHLSNSPWHIKCSP